MLGRFAALSAIVAVGLAQTVIDDACDDDALVDCGIEALKHDDCAGTSGIGSCACVGRRQGCINRANCMTNEQFTFCTTLYPHCEDACSGAGRAAAGAAAASLVAAALLLVL